MIAPTAKEKAGENIMIELSDTGIREICDDYFIVTTTFTVKLPVPGTFEIEATGKTIPEAVDNLISYIREHSDEDEITLSKIKEVIFGMMKDGERLLRIKSELTSSLCKRTWTGIDAVAYFSNRDELLTNQGFANWYDEKKPKLQDWTIKPNDEMTKKYNHMEAFKVMEYQCADCGQSEMIWNSRDGVTPMFLSGCLTCGGEKVAHVNWKDDRFEPDHIPQPGERVWIDMPDELRMPTARARMKSFDGTEHEEKDPVVRESTIRSIAINFPHGSPWLIVWPGKPAE